MKMKRVTVTWEKKVDAVVYVPEDMNYVEVFDLARETAESIDRDGWECDWDTFVSRCEDIDVPDEECRVVSIPGSRWSRPVDGSRFRHADAMVVDDEREMFVQAEDAKWWLAQPSPTDERNRGEATCLHGNTECQRCGVGS